MPFPRQIAFLGITIAHATLVALAGGLPDVVAPAVAGTVYLPLWLLQALGLPVFGGAPSGGWAGPSVLGWLLVAVIWAVVWWLLVAAVARMRGKP